jgi:hypothetical protein
VGESLDSTEGEGGVGEEGGADEEREERKLLA